MVKQKRPQLGCPDCNIAPVEVFTGIGLGFSGNGVPL
jgi:hypothetical protein